MLDHRSYTYTPFIALTLTINSNPQRILKKTSELKQEMGEQTQEFSESGARKATRVREK